MTKDVIRVGDRVPWDFKLHDGDAQSPNPGISPLPVKLGKTNLLANKFKTWEADCLKGKNNEAPLPGYNTKNSAALKDIWEGEHFPRERKNHGLKNPTNIFIL